MSEELQVNLSPAVRAQLERQKCADRAEQLAPERDVLGTAIATEYQSMVEHFNEHFEYGWDVVEMRTETPADGYDHYRVVVEAEGRIRPRRED